LEFNEPAQGLAFTALGIVNGEKTFNGYFIDITEIKVNGEAKDSGTGTFEDTDASGKRILAHNVVFTNASEVSAATTVANRGQ
jgi:hypothetical protein